MVVDDYTEHKNSVLNMVAALDTACQNAIDPPDGSPILISKRIFTGKKGRPTLWIDPVFLAVASKLRHTIHRLQIAYGIREKRSHHSSAYSSRTALSSLGARRPPRYIQQ